MQRFAVAVLVVFSALRMFRGPALIALLACGVFAQPGHGQSLDEKKFLKLQAEARRGVLSAEIELAADYLTGDGVPQDVRAAAHWYENAAQRGDSEAQNEIGYLYQTGVGVPADLSQALHWYHLAAASGSAAGKLNLGILYLSGLGVRKDVPLAMQLFEEGARKGNGTAAGYLGQIYYFGLAGDRDMPAAERWLEAGAKLHDPMAAYNLGSLYSTAPDHAHDLRRAAELLRQSAASGYVPAMYSLGLLLVNHPELKQTARESLTLLEAAAEAGEWRSSLLLGVLARDGKGVAVDRRSASYHFQIAVLQGGAEAEHLLRHDIDALSGPLDEDERAASTSAARAWYGQHPLTQPFLVSNHSGASYFQLRVGPEAIVRTFAQGGTRVGNVAAAQDASGSRSHD